MFMPWWRVKGYIINPAQVAVVRFDEETTGRPIACLYLSTVMRDGTGLRISVTGEDALRVHRLCAALSAGRAPSSQLGYYFPEDKEDDAAEAA